MAQYYYVAWIVPRSTPLFRGLSPVVRLFETEAEARNWAADEAYYESCQYAVVQQIEPGGECTTVGAAEGFFVGIGREEPGIPKDILDDLEPNQIIQA